MTIATQTSQELPSAIFGGIDAKFIDLIPAPAYLCDAPTGMVVRYNRRAAELWGVDGGSPTPFDGRYRLQRAGSTRSPEDETPFMAVLRSGEPVHDQEVVIERLDGREIDALVNVEALYDDDQRIIGAINVFQNISAHKLAEEGLIRLTESERLRRLYETILSSTPDLIYVFDRDHRFSYANSALLKMWGKTWEQAKGKNCLELGYQPWHAAMHDREIEQVIATRQPVRGEAPFSGTAGERIYEYIFVPVFAANGDVEAIAGTTRDVTIRKHMEQELQQRAEELGAADQKKDEFIALLAHELRNPLAPIRNGLHILEQATDDAAAIERVRSMMDRQLRHMVRIIDDLLDVSRISRNKLRLQKAPVAITEVVSNAIETARPSIEASAHELFVSLPPESIFVDADLTRLAQVFGNLLSNSIKYTKPGGCIWLAVEREGDQVVVIVRDNGCGIPPDAVSHLFEMFTQVQSNTEQSTGGLGIGLALVRSLVEMHGGTVTVASEGEDKGSVFTVKLPVMANPSDDQVLGSTIDQPRSRSPGRRVLVVDDNQDSCSSMAMLFQMLGNEVREAHDGLEALTEVEIFRPDIVLMDIGMPSLNGYDATRRIREQPWGENTTIIAITGWGQDGDRSQSKAAGCDGHLVKPVNLPDLEQLLAVLDDRG